MASKPATAVQQSPLAHRSKQPTDTGARRQSPIRSIRPIQPHEAQPQGTGAKNKLTVNDLANGRNTNQSTTASKPTTTVQQSPLAQPSKQAADTSVQRQSPIRSIRPIQPHEAQSQGTGAKNKLTVNDLANGRNTNQSTTASKPTTTVQQSPLAQPSKQAADTSVQRQSPIRSIRPIQPHEAQPQGTGAKNKLTVNDLATGRNTNQSTTASKPTTTVQQSPLAQPSKQATDTGARRQSPIRSIRPIQPHEAQPQGTGAKNKLTVNDLANGRNTNQSTTASKPTTTVQQSPLAQPSKQATDTGARRQSPIRSIRPIQPHEAQPQGTGAKNKLTVNDLANGRNTNQSTTASKPTTTVQQSPLAQPSKQAADTSVQRQSPIRSIRPIQPHEAQSQGTGAKNKLTVNDLANGRNTNQSTTASKPTTTVQQSPLAQPSKQATDTGARRQSPIRSIRPIQPHEAQPQGTGAKNKLTVNDLANGRNTNQSTTASKPTTTVQQSPLAHPSKQAADTSVQRQSPIRSIRPIQPHEAQSQGTGAKNKLTVNDLATGGNINQSTTASKPTTTVQQSPLAHPSKQPTDTSVQQQSPIRSVRPIQPHQSRLQGTVGGIFMKTDSMCNSPDTVARRFYQNSISVSVISINSGASKQNLDELDQSFMYTQILKDILLETKYSDQCIRDFSTYFRDLSIGNQLQLNNISTFEKTYRLKTPIYWYTYPNFLYSMLNRALRTLEVNTIIRIGFFVRDLHENIKRLHSEESKNSPLQKFVLFRGQELSTIDFKKIREAKGRLISFNNFLSTSRSESISLNFAREALKNSESVCILFKMIIDPSISPVPFASIDNEGYFKKAEQEVLFSMHTVFRIGETNQINNNSRLWQVELNLTSDSDQELDVLTKQMLKDTAGSTGWHRLGQFLIKFGKFDKAEEIYSTLLDATPDENNTAFLYNQLGALNVLQGNFAKALLFHKKSLEILQQVLPKNFSSLTTYHNNMGQTYYKMGDYKNALLSYKISLEMLEKTSSLNQSTLAVLYNNIGLMYDMIGESAKAILYYEKALGIEEIILPPNDPTLATSYNNIGGHYTNIGKYSKALSYYQKARHIFERILPSDHPDLALFYNNIGGWHENLGKHSEAMLFYEKSLEIYRKIHLSPNSDVAALYNNIGGAYEKMEKYSEALFSYKQSLEIYLKTLPSDHLDLARLYNNIACVCDNIGQYSEALAFYEKSFEIYTATHSSNHPVVGTTLNNIAECYNNMGKYSEALSFYQRAREILEATLGFDRSDLAILYNNIGGLNDKMEKYSEAMSFYEKSLDIYQKIHLSPKYEMATLYNNMGVLYAKMGAFTNACTCLERAVEIARCTLPLHHSRLQQFINTLDSLKQHS